MTDTQGTPACIGIILDGNRRWARERGLPIFEGHRRGMNNVEPIVLAARDLGVKHIVLYAFSTENWNRSKDEISYLMGIFEDTLRENLTRLAKERVQTHFVGQKERFPESLQRAMREAEKCAPADPRIVMWVCLSYGGRADIVQAASTLMSEGAPITEESLRSRLWTAGMPDPDLIIRTSGEKRLSNFLLWQGAYSELFFLDTYWPAFTKADLETVLTMYAARERRMGK